MEKQDTNEDGGITFLGEFHINETGDSVFSGKNVELAVEDRLLLSNAHFTLQRGHRYGLIGENGVGKTTLLQSIRAQIELDDALFRIKYVGQTDAESNAECNDSVLDYCASGDAKRSTLVNELQHLESLEDSDDYAANAERICEIMLELEKPDGSKERADLLLRRLGFLLSMRQGAVSKLSGGWRARLELARALFAEPTILFLDEPTNHLDLHAIFQLASLLRQSDQMTCVIVSHDASFLDLIATDILSINGCLLQSIAGNYSVFEEKASEYRRFHEHLYDTKQREKTRQKASTNQQRVNARRSNNDKALKQAASRERKKQERIGLYREDGKKYKLNSLKKLDASYVRLPSNAAPVKKQSVTTITLPQSHQQSISRHGPILELRHVSLTYPQAQKELLGNVDVQIYGGDRIALVGKNGAGKSTLLRALTGSAAPARVVCGEVKRYGRVAVVDQNQLALLEGHLEQSCVSFLKERHSAFFKTGGDQVIRKHLGQFGLKGDTALLPIGALSGGLRVRLVLADVFAGEIPPDVLLLDEPTNHLDGETIAALTVALKTFSGAVLAVSHNCAFLLEVFHDLWICEGGILKIMKEVEGCAFVDNFRTYAEKIVPQTEKQALQDMLRIRAARTAIVVQQAGASTSLMV